MFRLIESARRKRRSPTEAAVSLAVHTALIAAFVYATAGGGEAIMSASGRTESVTFAIPQAAEKAPAAAPRPKSQPQPSRQQTQAPPVPAIEEVGASDFSDAAATGLAAGDSPGERGAYYDYEVGVPTSPLGGLRPRYPETLRQDRVEGRVEVEFVVDERGRVDMETVRVIESTHTLFTASVRNALRGMRFKPAQANGRAVRQFVRLPVIFRIET